MLSKTGISLFLVVVCFSSVSAYWWDNLYWYEQKPSTCPYKDPDTHVCSDLASGNFTCVTIACCSYFMADDEPVEYDGDYTEKDDDEKVYYYGRVDDSCRVCYSVKNCTLYKCYRRCCDGFTLDYLGRCRNESGGLDCQNGGTPVRNYRHHYSCQCPSGFTGRSCEIPMCTCENGGECMVKDGKPFCNCSTGFTGSRCETAVCNPRCQNGGICVKDGHKQYCSCPSSFVGEYCERAFIRNPYCPAPQYNDTVGEYCYSDKDCAYNQMCCKEGRSTFCRNKQDYCLFRGRRYAVGESYKSHDSCEVCECMGPNDMPCAITDCAMPNCLNPVRVPGQCCPTCPDPEKPEPVRMDCPRQLVALPTEPRRDYAVLTERNTGVRTQGATKVWFEPAELKHCHCRRSCDRKHEITVYASNSASTKTCKLYAVVKDTEAPIITSCPDSVYIFEDEMPQWKLPTYKDNVGVHYVLSDWNPKKLRVGNYTNRYSVVDFDRNQATCKFLVVVSSRDTPVEQLPQGMRDRSSGNHSARLAIILAPIIGGLIILAVILVLVFCLKRRAAASAASRSPRRHPRSLRGPYENNIYALPGDIDIKPPVYCDLPMNPPAYSETGSLKDYKPQAPPSYTNEGYETLPTVHGLLKAKEAEDAEEKKSVEENKE